MVVKLGARSQDEPLGCEACCWHLMGAHLNIVGDPDWRWVSEASHPMFREDRGTGHMRRPNNREAEG
eukprot:4414287-Karenia_brevis.AAC.1